MLPEQKISSLRYRNLSRLHWPLLLKDTKKSIDILQQLPNRFEKLKRRIKWDCSSEQWNLSLNIMMQGSTQSTEGLLLGHFFPWKNKKPCLSNLLLLNQYQSHRKANKKSIGKDLQSRNLLNLDNFLKKRSKNYQWTWKIEVKSILDFNTAQVI